MEGVDAVWETVLEHRKTMQTSGEFDIKRRSQALDWLQALVDDGLRERFAAPSQNPSAFARYQRDVARGDISPTIAAQALLFFLDNPKSP